MERTVKPLSSTLVAALLAAGAIAAMPKPAHAQAAVELVELDVATVARGYRVSKLKGTNVTNDSPRLRSSRHSTGRGR